MSLSPCRRRGRSRSQLGQCDEYQEGSRRPPGDGPKSPSQRSVPRRARPPGGSERSLCFEAVSCREAQPQFKVGLYSVRRRDTATARPGARRAAAAV